MSIESQLQRTLTLTREAEESIARAETAIAEAKSRSDGRIEEVVNSDD